MKHHEYQIYYGGFKIKLQGKFWCKDCHQLFKSIHQHSEYLKKQSNNSSIKSGKVIPLSHKGNKHVRK